MTNEIKIALIGAAVAAAGWFVTHLLSRRKPPKSDKEVVEFFLACFDRSAFKTPFEKEMSEEDFIQAIEDTITAINTGKLLHREDRSVLLEGHPRHQLTKESWKRDMARIESILQEIRYIYMSSVKSGRLRIFEYQGGYHKSDRDPIAEKRIDQLKAEAIDAFKLICKEAGVEPYGLDRTA